MNKYEYRLKEIQTVLAEAEQELKNREQTLTDDVIKQRKLFIQKLKDEEQALLKELGVKTPKKEKEEETTSNDKKSTAKKEAKK